MGPPSKVYPDLAVGIFLYYDELTAKGGTNVQNLPKRTGDLTLRRSLTAPEDHVVIACDSTQVELRVNALMANQQDLLDVFASG